MDASIESGATTAAAAQGSDPCQALGASERRERVETRFGYRTTFNQEGSLFEVCEGFGAPDGVTFSPAMKCALIGAWATYAGPADSIAASRLCRAVSIADALEDRDWAGFGASEACDYFSQVFAGGVGVFVAGAASETGPGAVAIGVGTYKALASGLKIACGGIFDGGARDLGTRLESKHETAVALDVLRNDMCLRLTKSLRGLSWSAVRCAEHHPRNPAWCLDGQTPLLAYNLSCARALAARRRLPTGWTGANSDWTNGPGQPAGQAMLFRQRDFEEIVASRDRHGRPILSKLHGAPVIWWMEPYGE